MKKIFALLLSVAMVTSLFAGVAFAAVPVTGVTVSPTSLTLAVGVEAQLTPTIAPANATNPTVTYASSNAAVASVNATGLVTGNTLGTATIMVTTTDGGHVALVAVTVAPPVSVTGVTVAPATVAVGQTVTLVATVAPANATNRAVTWSSLNTGLATVNPDTGVVTGVAPGAATIVATTADGGFVGIATVTVTAAVPVTGVTVAPATVAVGLTVPLVATVAPANATNRAVTWSSLNTSLATVAPATGVVTGVAPGAATIVATTADGGFVGIATVTVTAFVPAVLGAIAPAAPAIVVGGTQQLTAAVTPATATDRTVLWTTSNAAVATVSASGLVTGVTAGAATITATVANGTAVGTPVSQTISVNVASVVPVTSVSVAPSAASLVVGATTALVPTVLPANATNRNVTWGTSNSAIATVSTAGLVTAVAPGTATITVTTADGGFTATSTITVNPVAVTGVTLLPEVTTVTVGTPQQLLATVLPASATNRALTWSTTNPAVAQVSALGVVTGVAPGTATIIVTTVEGLHTDTSIVHVVAAPAVQVPVSSVTLAPAVTTVTVGVPQALLATVHPANATNRAVAWNTTNPAVATVSTAGVVTGVAPGTATIIVTTADGLHTATSTVHVLAAPAILVTSVVVAPSAASLVVGATTALVPTVLPANATNRNVTWGTSNAAIATVNTAGVVTAVAPGTATITVTTVDGLHTATSAITVTTVPVAPATGNSFISFTIPGAVGTQIVEATSEIIITVPAGFVMPLGGVVPTFVASPSAIVSPAAAVPQTFVSPVHYTVISAAGVARTWRVEVTRPWFLSATVGGSVALERTAVLTGRVTLATSPLFVPTRAVSVQRRAPGSTEWANVGARIQTGGWAELLGGFNFTHTFTAAGDYRLAILTSDHAQAPALRIAGAEIVQPIGVVAAFPLVITTPSSNVAWNDLGEVTIPLSVIRQAVGGLPVNLTAAPVPAGMEQGQFFARYNGLSILPTRTTVDPATGVTSFTFRRPDAALMSGTLVIDATDMPGQWAGQIVVNLVARAPFNASTRIAEGTFTAGATVTLETTVFNAAGTDIADGEYTMTTITGPVTTTRLRMDGRTPGQVARTGALRINALGTITVTTVHFNATHHELGRVVETFAVRGGLVVNLTSARVGTSPVLLSATVTDLSGNPVNNALVTFTATNPTFVERSAVTGIFPAHPTIADASTIVTIDGSRPFPRAGHSVNNGVYTAEVVLLDVANVEVNVRRMLPGGPPWLHEPNAWITSSPTALVINPRLAYTVTLNQTTFVTAHSEVLTFTVRDAAGNLVAEPLASLVVEHGTGVLVPTFAPTQVSPGVWSGMFTSEEPGTVTIRMAGIGGNRVNGLEFTVTVVNPRVEISTSTTLVTSDFYEVITVRLFDPRNDQPISLPLQVREGRVRTPDRAWRPTAHLTLETRASAAAPWASFPTAGLSTGLGAAMQAPGGAISAQAVPTTTQVRNFAPAAVHEFRVLTWSRQQEIAGAEQPANLRFMASIVEGSVSELFAQTLAPATIALSSAEVRAGVNNSVTLTLKNAHGVAFGTIPQQGVGVNLIPAVYREIRAIGRWNREFNMPEGGVADLVIHIEPRQDGLIAGNIRFDVMSDRDANLVALRTDVRVVSPLDIAVPVIEVVAPATVTTATAQIVVTVTDDNMIALDGVAFNGVRFEMNAATTFTFVRNVDLVLGANSFIVSAMDRAGNVTNRTITITREAPAAADTAAPIIEVTVPAVTTEATAVVTVTVRDAVNIAANGIIFDGVVIPGFVSREQVFTRTVNLREGMNIFTVAAQDAAGNVATRTVAVERRTPPAPVSHVITIGRANPAIGLDVPANVRNGRLMVPFRWFGERILEATVDYRVVGAAEIVTLVKGNITVELTLNSTIATVNGTPVSLDVAAFATGGRTLVPARFLAETFGYTVNWNPADDSVTITKR